MNETPITEVATYSGTMPGSTQGMTAPATMPNEPASMGLRTPIRSDSRPADTASSISRNA